MKKAMYLYILIAVLFIGTTGSPVLAADIQSNGPQVQNQTNGNAIVDANQFSDYVAYQQQAAHYDFWQKYIDPFTYQKSDGTFDCNKYELATALLSDYPELFLQYENGQRPYQEDLNVIVMLLQSMEAGNKLIRESADPQIAFGNQFNENTDLVQNETERKASGSDRHWWGVVYWADGTKADQVLRIWDALSFLGVGAFTISQIFGWVDCPYHICDLTLLYVSSETYLAHSYNDRYGNFCITVSYIGYHGVSHR